LVFSTRNFKPGDQANVKIIGGMEMIDDGETDSKLLCVECNDSKYGQINDLGELNKEELNTIQHFFQTYKRFKNKTVIVRSFKDIN
jgi:inorganic pyrophosphatase